VLMCWHGDTTRWCADIDGTCVAVKRLDMCCMSMVMTVNVDVLITLSTTAV
jgi:hypothetical protein